VHLIFFSSIAHRFDNILNFTPMNCQRNVNSTLPTQLPHKFSYIVAILGNNNFESPNMSPAIVRRGVTKIRRLCAFVSHASTFLHLQSCLTQFFFYFFLQTRRFSRTSLSLQHFLLTINFLI
jgi:hypothetical protein